MNRALVLFGLTLVLACERSAPDAVTRSGAWLVADGPRMVAADSGLPLGHEFAGISSARLVRDGGTLVANAGASELVLFDSTGRFLRIIGRKGRGPGEWQGPISVFGWRADSLAVYDPASLRWTILDQSLTIGRTIPAPNAEMLQPTWLYQGAVINDGVLDPVPGWMMAALDSARLTDPRFRHLFQGRRDDLGALWLRDPLDRGHWTVHTSSAGDVVQVTLPTAFEPLQIGQDFVLGVARDSLGVEELRRYSLQRQTNTPPSTDGAAVAVPTDSTILAHFSPLMMAQELYYSTHARYANHPDSLPPSSAVPFRLFLLEGDARHWTAIAVRPETGATCGLSIGWPSPVGWLDGTPFCGR